MLPQQADGARRTDGHDGRNGRVEWRRRAGHRTGLIRIVVASQGRYPTPPFPDARARFGRAAVGRLFVPPAPSARALPKPVCEIRTTGGSTEAGFTTKDRRVGVATPSRDHPPSSNRTCGFPASGLPDGFTISDVAYATRRAAGCPADRGSAGASFARRVNGTSADCGVGGDSASDPARTHRPVRRPCHGGTGRSTRFQPRRSAFSAFTSRGSGIQTLRGEVGSRTRLRNRSNAFMNGCTAPELCVPSIRLRCHRSGYPRTSRASRPGPVEQDRRRRAVPWPWWR